MLSVKIRKSYTTAGVSVRQIDSMKTTQRDTDRSRWDDVSFVIRSRYRTAVLSTLAADPVTPTKIAEESNCRLSHVSRAIQQLRKRDLVELLVSEDQTKGRVYGITPAGSKAWDLIEAKDLR